MRDRAELGLKILCAVLCVVLAQQVVRGFGRSQPLKSVKVPRVPTWSPPAPKAESGNPNPAGDPGGPPPGAMPMPGMPGMPGAAPSGPGGVKAGHLVQSGLLGPVIRPPPMALMGIVGRDVILRSPEGQVGMIREGDRLGSVELVRVGTNRVLVRENGQEKELTIFQGYGGESLLPKAKGETK